MPGAHSDSAAKQLCKHQRSAPHTLLREAIETVDAVLARSGLGAAIVIDGPGALLWILFDDAPPHVSVRAWLQLDYRFMIECKTSWRPMQRPDIFEASKFREQFGAQYGIIIAKHSATIA